MLGFYSIAEIVDDSNKRPTKTILRYLEEGFNKHQIKPLQVTARLVKNNGIQDFNYPFVLIQAINSFASKSIEQVNMNQNLKENNQLKHYLRVLFAY